MRKVYQSISFCILFSLSIFLFINVSAFGAGVEELLIINQHATYHTYMADFQEDKLRVGIIGDIENFYKKYQKNINRKQFLCDYPYIDSPQPIQVGSKLIYKLDKRVKECRLVIQPFCGGRIKQYNLADKKLPIIANKGLYLYIFYVTWENGYGIFEQAFKVD